MVLLFLFLLSFAASSPLYPGKVNQYCLHSPFNATSLPAGLLCYIILPIPENDWLLSQDFNTLFIFGWHKEDCRPR